MASQGSPHIQEHVLDNDRRDAMTLRHQFNPPLENLADLISVLSEIPNPPDAEIKVRIFTDLKNRVREVRVLSQWKKRPL